MPIPHFDGNLVLPPHLGNPMTRADLSPYPCTTVELCQRFGVTPERRTILAGLLAFRERLGQAGVTHGFQWLDGSFLEDIEAREDRPPHDLDMVTFCWQVPGDPVDQQAQADVADRAVVKQTYHLDHYFVDFAIGPLATVEFTRYWVGLFSHRRDGVWKGMLRIELSTPAVDTDAKIWLEQQA